MKLWLLTRRESDTWIPAHGYYCEEGYYGFVIRAQSEEAARRLAQGEGGEELYYVKDAWTNPELSRCVELTAALESEEIILTDWRGY